MAFGFAGAGAGAADALQEMLAQKRAAFLQQEQLKLQQAASQRAQQGQDQQADQFGQRMAFDQQREASDQAERQRVAQRQTTQDNLQQSAASNQAGVRRMLGDFLQQRGSQPMTAGDRQQLLGMSVSEGVELPEQVLEDPNAEAEAQRVRDERLHKQRLTEIGAQGSETRRTALQRAEDSQEPPSAYGAERAARTLESVRNLKGKVSNWTAGAGSVLAGIPSTDARNFRAELDTLKANIAFNELAEMRAASKTGGALGAIAIRELELLESSQGALDQGQSPENLAAQLGKIEDTLARWNSAKAQQGLAGGLQGTRGGGGGGPKVGDVKTFPNGRTGRYDGKGWVPQ